MEAVIDQPGPIEVKTVGADWEANLSGLLNIKDPKAVQAGLKQRKEPIQIYTHVVRHPTRGFFLVDTGVSRRLPAPRSRFRPPPRLAELLTPSAPAGARSCDAIRGCRR